MQMYKVIPITKRGNSTRNSNTSFVWKWYSLPSFSSMSSS